MFGSIVYFDSVKIDEYKAVIRNSKNLRIEKISISNDKGVETNIPIANFGIKATKSYEASFESSMLYECAEFETLLNGRDDYFDFTSSSDYEIATLQRGHIIKFDSTLTIPEAFDLTQIIAQFKPMLINSMSKEMKSDEQEAFKSFFASTDYKIPMTTECDDTLLCSKINAKELKYEYAQLEELETLEVTILARIISGTITNKNKAIFDPLKDFITLNRSMRRTMATKRPEGLEEVFVDEDYRMIEVLAIYQ